MASTRTHLRNGREAAYAKNPTGGNTATRAVEIPDVRQHRALVEDHVVVMVPAGALDEEGLPRHADAGAALDGAGDHRETLRVKVLRNVIPAGSGAAVAALKIL